MGEQKRTLSLGALASPAGCRQHSPRGCVSEPEVATGQEIRVPAAQPPTQGPPQHPDQLPGGPGKGGRKGGQRCPQGLASLKPQALPCSGSFHGSPWLAISKSAPSPVSPNSSLRSRLISCPGCFPPLHPSSPPHPETPPCWYVPTSMGRESLPPVRSQALHPTWGSEGLPASQAPGQAPGPSLARSAAPHRPLELKGPERPKLFRSSGPGLPCPLRTPGWARFPLPVGR